MKFSEKIKVDQEVNNDILIGICLGIIGNALFQWYYKKYEDYWGIIIITGIVLLVLVYNKKSSRTKHLKQVIPALITLQDIDILHIITEIQKELRDEWKNVYKGKLEVVDKKIIVFYLDKKVIFKLSVFEASLQIEYYEKAESEYLLEVIMKKLDELKNKQGRKLFQKNQIKDLTKAAPVQGEIESQ